jgi:putative salt-induced outer membrane protein YdiY
MPFRRHSMAPLLLLALHPFDATFAQATATLVPDDRWHFALGAGATVVSGNNSSRSLNIGAEGVKLSDHDRIGLYGRTLDVETEDQRSRTLAAGAGYNRDFTPLWFGLTKVDYLEDPPSNLDARRFVLAGIGRHLVRSDSSLFDVSLGLGHTSDRFVQSVFIAGAERSGYDRAEIVLSENSEHKFTPTTSWRQKLELYSDTRDRGRYRAVFDTGLSVAMTQTLSLTATLNHRYESDPGDGIGHNDTQFVTGISVKLD